MLFYLYLKTGILKFKDLHIKENKYLTYLNVGTGKDITIKELALTIARKVDFRGEIIWDKTKPDGTPKNNWIFLELKVLDGNLK